MNFRKMLEIGGIRHKCHRDLTPNELMFCFNHTANQSLATGIYVIPGLLVPVMEKKKMGVRR